MALCTEKEKDNYSTNILPTFKTFKTIEATTLEVFK